MRRDLLLLSALTTAIGVAAVACAASPSPARLRWRALNPDVLAPAADVLQLAALQAPNPAGPWLLGGNTRNGLSPHQFPDVAIWQSPDGQAWTRSALHGLTLDAPQNLVFGIARSNGVSVAVGATLGMAHNNPRPTIWRSTDGAWAEVPTLREDFGGPMLTDLRAVVAGPTGFTVLGNWKADDGRPVIAVWLSTDGFHWTREDHIPELTSRDGEELTADSIAAGPGGLVITGVAYDPIPSRPDHVDGFIATSSDGRAWRRADAATAGLDNQGQVAVRQVLAEGNSFVAFGTRSLGSHNEVAAWRPTPTSGWTVTTVAVVPLVLGTALAVDGDTIWAAVATDEGLRLWRSKRGGRWQPVTAPAVSGPERVLLGAARARLVLAVQTGKRAGLWVAPG